MEQKKRTSPCEGCTRVKEPAGCENKRCGVWNSWFLSQWELLRGYPRRMMDAMQVPVEGDPCVSCASPRELCSAPCRSKLAWEKKKEAQV